MGEKNLHMLCTMYSLYQKLSLVNQKMVIKVTLSPHDALKHHFTSLKTDLFSYNYGF